MVNSRAGTEDQTPRNRLERTEVLMESFVGRKDEEEDGVMERAQSVTDFCCLWPTPLPQQEGKGDENCRNQHQ